MKRICLLVVFAACGAQISGEEARQQGRPDAPSSDPDPDPDPDPTNPPDAPPPVARCDNGRVVFLNFEGVTIKSTQARSDATLDAAYWSPGTRVIPRYHANSANRTGEISAITNYVTQGLSQFPVTVVTTRPAAGPYMMIVFGGRSTTNIQISTEYYGIQTLDCGDTWLSDVAWVSDLVPTSEFAASVALGAIGYGLGLSGTTTPSDCMCGWATNCDSPQDTVCSFTSSATTADQCNGGTVTQDAIAAIDRGFCQPL